MKQAQTTQVTWHSIPQDWQWSHVVTIPDHDHDHPWGDEWPTDYLAALEYLSQWDYGDAAPDTVTTNNVDHSQSSRVMDCALVPFAGLYCIVSDVMGGIALYRCEEDMETIAKHLR